VHYDNLKSAHYSEDYLSTFRRAAITIYHLLFTIYQLRFTNVRLRVAIPLPGYIS
jgi:hypothetical protein